MPSALRGPTRVLALAGTAFTLLFAPGCDDDDPVAPSVAFELQITSGNNQTLANGAASAAMVVTLFDQYGDPMAGQAVSWVIAAGGGTLAAGASTTDTDGEATMTYTAGLVDGAISIEARVTNVPNVVFNHTVQ